MSATCHRFAERHHILHAITNLSVQSTQVIEIQKDTAVFTQTFCSQNKMWIWSFQTWLWNSEAIVELLGYEAVHDGFDVAWASGNKTRVAFRAGCVFARWISGGSWLLSNPRSDWDFGWNDFCTVFFFALLAGQGLSSSVLPGSLQHMAVHASAVSHGHMSHSVTSCHIVVLTISDSSSCVQNLIV